MNIQDHDWTSFKRQIFIKADCETVFKAWTTANDITAWFIAEACYTTAKGRERAPDEQIEPGDHYFWRWHQDATSQGEILAVEPNTHLRFSFGDNENKPDGKVIVTVSFHALQGETLVELQQDNMPTSEEAKLYWYTGCNMGWNFFMTNLKAWLEHGADLREYDSERAYAARAISL